MMSKAIGDMDLHNRRVSRKAQRRHRKKLGIDPSAHEVEETRSEVKRIKRDASDIDRVIATSPKPEDGN